MKNNEEKLVYGVIILRKGLENIIALETKDFNEAKILWEELHENWSTSIKENTPMKLESPVLTTFDPGTIAEIIVRASEEQRLDNSNPYVKKMKEKGFSQSFGGTDILDGGYNL